MPLYNKIRWDNIIDIVCTNVKIMNKIGHTIVIKYELGVSLYLIPVAGSTTVPVAVVTVVLVVG